MKKRRGNFVAESLKFYQLTSFLSLNRLAMHEESSSRRKVDDDVHDGAIPAYLMDRETTTRAKVCSVRCNSELLVFLLKWW